MSRNDATWLVIRVGLLAASASISLSLIIYGLAQL